MLLLIATLSPLRESSAADEREPVAALSESEQKRRCPVESSVPIPSHIQRAVAARGDVQSQANIVVPLHVHIIANSQGYVPISSGNLNATIARLNSGFAKTGFSFYLASVETVVNDVWAYVPKARGTILDDMASTLNTGNQDSANIYITLLEALCGLASLPYAEDPYEAIYVDARCLPGGDSPASYDTIIHEMGHFLGLFHTFAQEPNGCRGKGDFVEDTPYQKVPHFKCRRYDTCPSKPGVDPVRNYMDYTDDACTNRFSRGQIKLMQSAHSYYRIQTIRRAGRD